MVGSSSRIGMLSLRIGTCGGAGPGWGAEDGEEEEGGERGEEGGSSSITSM